MRKVFVAIAVVLLLTGTAAIRSSADSVMDSWNAGLPADNTNTWADVNNGWTWTASSTYFVTGIDTRYSSADGRTVTLDLFDGSPSGTLLGTTSFTAQADPVWSGGDFGTPIEVTAGHTYFAAFLGVNGLGLNVANNGSAVPLVPEYYDFGGTPQWEYVDTGGDEYINGILRIRGNAVPEPAFYQLGALLALGGLGMLRMRKRA